MKTLLIALLCLLPVCASAQPQSDDIAFARNPDTGATLSLSMQECPFGGFHWWHMEAADGSRLGVGCWTFATHHRIMLTDGKGGATLLPDSRFSSNPHYGD